ncbi:unnamed protein product [Clavelina lepadiformis]|uniref:Uncharacterized protein n=1 Tax=Clavelina lepadiformis TaxID=159417 RepID=A0ABP0G284_CLALP
MITKMVGSGRGLPIAHRHLEDFPSCPYWHFVNRTGSRRRQNYQDNNEVIFIEQSFFIRFVTHTYLTTVYTMITKMVGSGRGLPIAHRVG